MPTLCVFNDLHSISLLLYKSDAEYWFETFPYTYASNVFSSSFSVNAFYKGILNNFCEVHNLVLKDCSVIVSGTLEPPKLDFDVALTLPINDVFGSIKDVYPVLVNSFILYTPDVCLSASTVNLPHLTDQTFDNSEENYYSNLELYPQILSTDIASQIDIDTNITALTDLKPMYPSIKPLVYCGSRFSTNPIFPELDYLLMLSLVRNPGIYELKRDPLDSVILTAMLKLFIPKSNLTTEVLINECTLVSSNSPLECVAESPEGTSQLVLLEKNKILVLPAGENDRIKLKVKSKDLGSLERVEKGGKVGIIFDTRDNKKISVNDIRVFTSGLKTFKSLLNS